MTTEVSAQGITITRTFDAPRELVFAAWTDPQRFAYWYGTAASEVTVQEWDLRPGGRWRALMKTQNHGDINWHGEFVEIDAPSRLVMTVSDRPGDAREPLTIDLTEVDGKTEMVFTQTGGSMDEAGYGRAAEGWGSFFDALEENIA